MSTKKQPTAGRAAVYLRKSTVDAKGIFEQHRRDVADLAERLGAKIDPDLIFVEDDVSASKPRRADTAWGKLLVAVERERPAYVLSQAADRLGRRLGDLEGLHDMARRDGFTVQTVTEGDLFASLIWPFIAARAKTETMYTSVRIKAAQERRRREGKPSGGGNRPFGFEVDRMTIREDEAAIVREMARRVLAGERTFTIARDLNERGVPTTEAERWHWQMIRAIATDRSASLPPKRVATEIKQRVDAGENLGVIAADLTRRKVPALPQGWTVSRVRNILSRPRYTGLNTHHGEIVGDGAWPAILERPTWNAVQQVLKETANETGRPYGSLLGGLAVCLACAPPRPMWCMPWGDKAGSKVYLCKQGHGARRQDVLENFVLSHVLPAVSDAELGAAQDAIMSDAEPVKDRIVTLELQMYEATEQYQAGQIEGRDFYPLLGRLRKEHDAAEREHAKLMRQFDSLNESKAEREHWDTLTHEERRAFLRRHLHAVEVKPRPQHTSIAREITDDDVTLVWRDRPPERARSGRDQLA